MKKTRQILLLIYGEGGHRTEMHRLLAELQTASQDLKVVSLGPKPLSIDVLAHYTARDIRRKNSRFNGLLLSSALMSALGSVIKITNRYDVVGAISTGPGLSIAPMLLLRLLGVKVVFIETFCRFQSRSFTGRVMSKLAHRFLIQNKDLQTLYPDAEYSGRL